MNAVEFATILQQGETSRIEFKGPTAFDGGFQAHLAAAITAFANSAGGGTILIGIEDGSRRVQGVTPEQLATFDPTRISKYLSNRVQPLPRFGVETYDDPNGTVVVIRVAEFETTPHLVIREIAASGRTYAREGDLLIRSESRECRRITSAAEWDDLLQRALRGKGEWLIGQMRSVFLGAPAPAIEIPPTQQFEQALPDWQAMRADLQTRHPAIAYWDLCLLPLGTDAMPLAQVADLVRQSVVTWRGWDFPQRSNEPKYRARSVGATLRWISDNPRYPAGHDDAWLATENGAFGSFSTIWSELPQPSEYFPYPVPPDRPLPWTEIIYGVTEHLRFAATYADLLGCDHLWVQVALRNVRNRLLGTYGGELLMPYQPYQCFDSAIVRERVTARAELIGNWREIALVVAQQIYTAFQLPTMSRDRLWQLQQKLIDMRA